LAGGVAFFLIALLSNLRPTPYDNYVLLAQALLGGHVWIAWPGSYIDALAYNGQRYIIEGPLPALLLLPAVALFGTHANQTLLGALLAAIAVGAAWELGERFAVPRANIVWICAFLLAGTDLLWCAILGDVWFLAHVSACCFTLLALVELAGKRRGWLVALCAVCAVESRFSMAVALPVYAYLVMRDRTRGEVVTACAGFAGVLIVAAVWWVAYNEARWGTWTDIGYTAWYHQDLAGMPTGSPFRLMYLPYQLWSFFVQWPTQVPAFPWLRPEFSGVALTWTSPALLLAFFARAPVRWTIALWVAAILTAVPDFLYYVNGFAQFGMRHALDFEPFLVALMLLAVRGKFPKWGYVLTAYSVTVGVWGCWYWHTFVRA
jgi:hypothetical protein